jgi:L-rhamnose mutarotase
MGLERKAWRASIKEGCVDEYKKRHDEIWPEMLEMFKEAKIRNYSIWNVDDCVFGYYECDSVEEAGKVQELSEVNARWSAYMNDVMEMEKDPVTGAQPLLKQVFLYED